MRTVFYTCALRHRADNRKVDPGPISRTAAEHARAIHKIKVEGSEKYDCVFDFGLTKLNKFSGISRPQKKHATHSIHKPKPAGSKS